jgi:hypothetical protein
MATATDPKTPNIAESLNEATRATAEASRRTMQSTQEAVRVSRDFAEQSALASRKLFAAYTMGLTAGLKATYEVQNAAYAAGLSWFETAAATDRELFRQMLDVVRQSEQVSLDLWQAGIHATEKVIAPSAHA